MQNNTEHFLQLWSALFNFTLGKSNGVGVWAAFINDDFTDYDTFCQAVEGYGRDFAKARERGYVAQAPTFAQVKGRYFALKKQQKVENNRRQYGDGASLCGICFGRLQVVVLAPFKSDRDHKNWPADYRHLRIEEYTGIEVAPCPVCCADKYPNFETRKRLETYSLPEEVGPRHPARLPDFCPGAVVGGDMLLREYVSRAAHPREPAASLERSFPA